MRNQKIGGGEGRSEDWLGKEAKSEQGDKKVKTAVKSLRGVDE